MRLQSANATTVDVRARTSLRAQVADRGVLQLFVPHCSRLPLRERTRKVPSAGSSRATRFAAAVDLGEAADSGWRGSWAGALLQDREKQQLVRQRVAAIRVIGACADGAGERSQPHPRGSNCREVRRRWRWQWRAQNRTRAMRTVQCPAVRGDRASQGLLHAAVR